jgi:hypothetical protein
MPKSSLREPAAKPWERGNAPSRFWHDRANRERYLKWLGRRLGFTRQADWYSITKKDFEGNKGSGLLDFHNGSPSAVVTQNISYEWKPWLFRKSPSGMWDDPTTRQRYWNWLAETLGLEGPEAWYRVSQKDFVENHGKTFLDRYRGSPIDAVLVMCPDYDWKEWLFSTTPNGFWASPANRRRYMEWLASKLGFKAPADWYQLTAETLLENRGSWVFSSGGTISKAVRKFIPDFNWQEWLFSTTRKGFWNSRRNQLEYMHWLGQQLGFRRPQDWYRVTQEHFHSHAGASLLKKYGMSAFKTVMALIPAPKGGWLEWHFSRVPQTHWRRKENRLRYLKWLESQLRFKQPEDWYAASQELFEKHSGGGLIMDYYAGSPALAAKELYPAVDWKPWLFTKVPPNFWATKRNRVTYMKWLYKQLGFNTREDWYTITRKAFIDHQGAGLMQNYYGGSPVAVVVDCVAGKWDQEKFSLGLKRQKQLHRAVKRLFQKEEIKWNFKHPDIRFPGTKRAAELDIWLPALRIAFEYQGEQHFVPIRAWGGRRALRKLRARDRHKREECERLKILLIEIEYTWDGTSQSLCDRIRHVMDKQKGWSALAKWLTNAEGS